MKLMKTQRIPDEDAEPGSHVARRRFLGVVGGGGLATAATVFGFATPASAASTVKFGCCTLCCRPSHTVAQCETGFHYVWQCSESLLVTCQCCEHQSPCHNGCNSIHYSSYSCM